MFIALSCVLFAALLPVFTVAIAKWGPGLDNHYPRDWAGTLTGYRRRAHAAHANHYEAFPFFAAGVLTALFTRAPEDTVALLAIIFIVARVIFTACYLADRASLRSIAWIVGWIACIALFGTGLAALRG